MTDKRIKSFLEDRLKKLESIRNKREWTTAELGDIVCCKQTLAFIDTLEVKEVDLDSYYHEFLEKEWFNNSHVRTVSEMMAFTARHFFELGMQVSNKTQKEK